MEQLSKQQIREIKAENRAFNEMLTRYSHAIETAPTVPQTGGMGINKQTHKTPTQPPPPGA